MNTIDTQARAAIIDLAKALDAHANAPSSHVHDRLHDHYGMVTSILATPLADRLAASIPSDARQRIHDALAATDWPTQRNKTIAEAVKGYGADYMDKMPLLERIVFEAYQVVERGPAHELLTKASVKLGEARDAVREWYQKTIPGSASPSATKHLSRSPSHVRPLPAAAGERPPIPSRTLIIHHPSMEPSGEAHPRLRGDHP